MEQGAWGKGHVPQTTNYLEVRSQRSEVGKTEVRGRRSEGGSRRSEGRDPQITPEKYKEHDFTRQAQIFAD